jgi:hypothetical protein
MSTYSLTYNTKLTEDFIHAESILASSSALAPLATFVNPSGQTEALVIHDDGELCHLQREPLSSSGWNIFGIGAQVNLIAAANSGSVWITDNGEGIWQSNVGHWNPLGNVNGGLRGISAGRDGAVYALAEQGNGFHLFTYDSGSESFQDTGVVNISEAPKGSAGSLWSLANDTVMMSTTPGQWNPAPGSFESGDTPTYISIGIDGSVFVLCSGSGAIYSYDASSQSWAKLMQASESVVGFEAVNAQTLYAVQQNNSTEILCYSGGLWSTIAGPPYGINGISTGSDGSLWCLDSSGTVWRSDAGNWIRQMIPTDLPGITSGDSVTEVVTGLHSDGNQYVFYVETGDLYVSMLDRSKSWDGIWTEGSPIVSGCSNLGMTIAPGPNATWNELVVYGVSSVGTFLLVTCNNGDWTAAEFTVGTEDKTLSLIGARVQYAAVNREIWWLWVVVGNELYGQTSLNFTKPPTSLTGYPLPNSASAQTIIPFSAVSHSSAGLYTAVLDTTGQVWFAALDLQRSYTPQFTQLSGAAIESPIGTVQGAVALCSAQPSQYTTNARIFARDANNTLWIIRLTVDAQTPTAPYTWSEWHPLGNDCVFLANGPANVPSTDLFMLDEGYEVNVLSEDVTSGVWRDLVMLKPAGTNTDAQYVNRYLSEVTITDQYGSPAPNFQVSVTADEPIGIWIGASLYNVGTTTPAQLTTNQLGQITFAFFADDIHTPTFSFAADGLTDPPSIYPAQAVNDYLSGSADALPGRPAFDSAGAALGAAAMQVAPDWEAGSTTTFVQGDVPQANVAGAAQTITQVYTIPLSPSGTSGQWSPAASSPDALLGGSSFWHDVCNYSHDIDHAIKKAAMTVSTAVVDVENKIVSFTIELANGLSQVLQLAINTAKDVVSAVKSAFRYIERGIDEAIDWLKSLFSWGDILNTKRVIEAGLTGMMSRIAANFDQSSPYYIGTLFNQYFDEDVKGKITAGFATLKSQFSNQNLSDVSNQTPYPPSAAPMGNDALHPTKVSGAQSSNGTQTNYVHGHVTTYANNGGTFPAQAGGDGTSGDSVMQTLFNAIESNLLNKDTNNNFQPMETCNKLQQIFSNPSAFADVAINDVLNAAEDAILAILDVIEGVFDALFELAANALAGFQKVLTAVLDIPVISWIYQKISGAPLTLLDLFCLIMAVPTTIGYKLTFGLPGGAAPFSSTDVTAIQQQFAPANFPWPVVGGGSAIAEIGAARTNVGSFPFASAGILMVLNGAVYGIFDCLNDLLAHSTNVILLTEPGYEGDPIASFYSWVSIVTTFVSQWLSAPYDIFPGPATVAESMTLSLWSLNFIPFISGLVFTVVSKDHVLSEFNGTYGVYLSTAIGLTLLAVGIATSVEQIEDSTDKYGPCYWVQNLIAPLPTIFKPLVTVTTEPDGSIASACLIGCDAVMDLANCSLGFVEDAL